MTGTAMTGTAMTGTGRRAGPSNVRFVTAGRNHTGVSEPMLMLLGERTKRPVFARPTQPRTPNGRRYGHRPGRRRYRLPG
ncbi:MAG: hypothetical protein QOF96_2604 [Actinomycetota bacterium]|nr:hypothetical protein [Actinomycetota bacterium]